MLLLSPTLLILTYKESWKPIAQKILKVIRIPLFTAIFLTIVYTVFRTGELLKNMNLSWLSLVLICYMILCFILLIIAETFAGRRR